MSGIYRLTFMLPPTVLAPPGRHQPCLHGCVLVVDRGGLVSIAGPSLEQVFEQARRFFRIHAKGRPAMSIGAVLSSPARIPMRDGWSIVVGAEVSFTPAAVVDIGEPGAAA